ncbi:MAG: DUF4292 domain-containing protein [Pseudomonadota bacterium]
MFSTGYKNSGTVCFFTGLILAAIIFSSGCAGITGRVPETTGPGDLYDPQAFISALKEKNADLRYFKGKGKITYWENNKKNSVTGAAWIGLNPDRLRIALRSVSGQPLVSFASDGKWFYLFLHSEGRFYKKRSSDSNLKRFISIPIDSADMVSILSGRIPVRKHSSAAIINTESGNEYILVLKKWWGDVLEKIYFDALTEDVFKIEMFSGKGTLGYRAELFEMQNINGYRIPSRMVFSTENGSVFQLDIDEYWVDISASPSVFQLTPPEQGP